MHQKLGDLGLSLANLRVTRSNSSFGKCDFSHAKKKVAYIYTWTFQVAMKVGNNPKTMGM
jgi:hypothetical protein